MSIIWRSCSRQRVARERAFSAIYWAFFSAFRGQPSLVFHRQERCLAGKGTKGLWGAPLPQGATPLLGTPDHSPCSLLQTQPQAVATALGGWQVTFPAPRRKGRAILAAREPELHTAATGVCAGRCPSLQSTRQQSTGLITKRHEAALWCLTALKIYSCCHLGAEGRNGSSTYQFVSLFCFYIT